MVFIGIRGERGKNRGIHGGLIGVIMENVGAFDEVIEAGDRVAQAVLAEVPRIKWVPVVNVDELSTTERGEGGFGSTGQ